MVDEVRQLAAEHANIQTHFRYSEPLESDMCDKLCDSTGILDVALLHELLPNNDAEFYFCGPKEFMIGIYRGLKAWGVDDARIHFEFFGPRQDISGGQPVAADSDATSNIPASNMACSASAAPSALSPELGGSCGCPVKHAP
jgi:ferredoxin-NADP reductase